MRNLLLLGLVVFSATMSGCSGAPTLTSIRESNEAVVTFDGGVFGGSGNEGTRSQETETAGTTAVATADSANGRGGVFGGSGNRTQGSQATIDTTAAGRNLGFEY